MKNKDKERIQPKAGRLDLLLQDEDERFEVEIQLGLTLQTIRGLQHLIAGGYGF